MESVTSLQATTYQISQQRPDARPAGEAARTASPAVGRPEEQTRLQALQRPTRTRPTEAEERQRRQDVKEQIEQINRKLRSLTRDDYDVNLVYEDRLENVVVEVREKESGDLVAQWPTEEMVAVRAVFRQMLGMVVDRKS